MNKLLIIHTFVLKTQIINLGPEKCGRLIIWNMSPILTVKQEKSDDVPKKLCQMDNHLACINCVRWSNNGKYLASAGDDKNLMVWQLAGRTHHSSHHHHKAPQSNVFESANVEHWRCTTTLNGHNGDILDLAWCPHDQYLASCSVDNMIIIWDANNFPQVITKITKHTGLVKGVSWDPTSKYLASQSDDKTLRVWRTSDWREEKIIKEPFKECGGTTHVLRLDWSPDGQILVSAHAMNNSGSVAQLIERDGWKTQRDLVGHRKAVTCVRFNPNILYENKTKVSKQTTLPVRPASAHSGSVSASIIANQSNGITPRNVENKSQTTKNKTSNPLGNKTIKYCCMAVGSRDRSISIWQTSQPRPLLVAHDLFESSVLDVSWSRDGNKLIACSQDGSVAVMLFATDEIGHKLKPDEKQAHLQKLYGKSILTANQPSTKTLVVEDPDLLINAQAIEQNQGHYSDMPDQIQNSHSNSISQNGFNGCESNTSMGGLSKGPTDRQIETLLPGGKRRITPLYIQPPLPFNSTSSITFSSSKESKTKILIETTSSTPAPTPTPSYTSNTPVKSTAPLTQQTTPDRLTSVLTKIRKETTIVPRVVTQRTLTPSKIDKATVFRIKDSKSGKELILEAENDTSLDKIHELRLLDSSNNKSWEILLSSRINSVIATQNLAVASCIDNSIHLFELQSGRRLVPPLVLDSQVAHIAAEREHLLVITSSAHMWLWDISQNKVLVKAEPVSPLLPMRATTSREKPTKANSSKSGADKSSNNKTSGEGDNHNTNNQTGTTNHNNITNANNNNYNNNNQQQDNDMGIITSCSLTEHYQPLILLSNGKAFIFDYINLQCWQLISDTTDFITRWSNCKPSLAAIKRFLSQKLEIGPLDEHGTLKRNLPLTSLQSQQQSHSIFDLKRFANTVNSDRLQVKATRSYLDHQLASALAIRSPHEYHYWLIQSVQHYVDTGAEARLKDLCSRLISGSFGDNADGTSVAAASANANANEAGGVTGGGGDYDNSGRSNSQSRAHNGCGSTSDGVGDITSITETRRDILGLSKRNLLKEVLAILSKDLRYQRIYSEYKHLLDHDSTSVSDMIISLDPNAMIVDK